LEVLVLLLPVYVVGFAALIVLVVYGMAILRMTSVRVRRSRNLRRIDPSEIRPDTLQALRDRGAELEAIGFEACGAIAEDYFVDGVEEPSFSLVYRSPISRSPVARGDDAAPPDCIARITLAESPTRIQPVECEFYSFSDPLDEPTALLQSTALLQTVGWRLHRLSPGLPGQKLSDAKTFSWDEQFAAHCLAVADEGATGSLVPLDADSFVSRLRAFWLAATEFEIDEQRLLEREDGTLGFSLRWAVATVLRANRGERARLKALAETKRAEAGSAAEGEHRDVSPDLAAHRRREEVDRRRTSGWITKLVLLAGSMTLFAIAFGFHISARFAVLLVAALLVHELGHAVAMRLFGYRDLQILFIPMVGAVASGRKQDVAPWQEIVVLLAGPVPGIIAGTAILAVGWGEPGGWIRDGANMLLLLNYLNLLPIVPLDGGRVLSIVLFDRFPLVQLAFSATSAAAVAVTGVWAGDAVIFIVGLAFLAGVPRQLTQMRIFTSVRDMLQRTRAEAGSFALDPVRSIYAELRAAKFDRWNSETKYQFVQHVKERLGRRVAGLRVAVASLAAYAAVLVLPVGFISYTQVPEPEARLVARGEAVRSSSTDLILAMAVSDCPGGCSSPIPELLPELATESATAELP
jgi:Zn-dependent protease